MGGQLEENATLYVTFLMDNSPRKLSRKNWYHSRPIKMTTFDISKMWGFFLRNLISTIYIYQKYHSLSLQIRNNWVHSIFSIFKRNIALHIYIKLCCSMWHSTRYVQYILLSVISTSLPYQVTLNGLVHFSEWWLLLGAQGLWSQLPVSTLWPKYLLDWQRKVGDFYKVNSLPWATAVLRFIKQSGRRDFHCPWNCNN